MDYSADLPSSKNPSHCNFELRDNHLNLECLMPLIEDVKDDVASQSAWLSSVKWNKSILREADLETLYKEQGVLGFHLKYPYDGVYRFYRKEKILILNSDLSEPERTYTGMYLLSLASTAPEKIHYSDMNIKWAYPHRDCLANIFAACALIPRPMIENLTYFNIERDFGYPLGWYEYRLRTRLVCGL